MLPCNVDEFCFTPSVEFLLMWQGKSQYHISKKSTEGVKQNLSILQGGIFKKVNYKGKTKLAYFVEAKTY
jgi:hypothetical protein